MENAKETEDLIEFLYEKKVVDIDNHNVGHVDNVYVDDVYDMPAWFTVRVGFFGNKKVFLPAHEIKEIDDDTIMVPWPKDVITDSPQIKDDNGLTKKEEEELFSYYNIDFVETKDHREALSEETVEEVEAERNNQVVDGYLAEDAVDEPEVIRNDVTTEENVDNHDDARPLDQDERISDTDESLNVYPVSQNVEDREKVEHNPVEDAQVEFKEERSAKTIEDYETPRVSDNLNNDYSDEADADLASGEVNDYTPEDEANSDVPEDLVNRDVEEDDTVVEDSDTTSESDRIIDDNTVVVDSNVVEDNNDTEHEDAVDTDSVIDNSTVDNDEDAEKFAPRHLKNDDEEDTVVIVEEVTVYAPKHAMRDEE